MSKQIKDVMTKLESFGFAELQADMDAEVTQIGARQESSDISLKSLIELTRQFCRDTPEETRDRIVPLLKRYQTEVDSLCQRSKAAESAYFGVYTKLIELPDVSLLLNYGRHALQQMAQLADLQIERDQLRQTLDDYNSELQHVRRQDVMIKQLNEQLKMYTSSQDELVEKRVQQAEQQLQRNYLEREQTHSDERLLLTRQLQEAQLQLAQLTSALDLSQNELVDLKLKWDELSGARNDELELMTEELARSDERAALAEREVHTLKEQLAASHKALVDPHSVSSAAVSAAAAASAAANSATLGTATLDDSGAPGHRDTDLELAAKEKEISHLMEDVRRLQSQLSCLRSQSVSQQQQLEQQLLQRNQLICRLELVIERQKDYDEVKKELQIMKSIEFPSASLQRSTVDTTRDHDDPDCDREEIGTDSERPLDVLLLEKTRALQHENTTLKNSRAVLQVRAETAEQECQQLSGQLQQLQQLVQVLEADLARLNTIAERVDSSASDWIAEAVRDTYPPTSSGSAAAAGAAAAAADADPPAAACSGSADSLLAIVTAQRERFRLRINELEELVQLQWRERSLKETEVEDLRTDNLKLYEKIKYLQSYSANKPRVVHQDVDTRYSQQYESGLDPFVSFTRRERRRKYVQMNAFEKIMHAMAEMIVSSRTARLAAVFYAIVLHLLVFAVLYRLAYSEAIERDYAEDCAVRYAEHMAKAHNKNDSKRY